MRVTTQNRPAQRAESLKLQRLNRKHGIYNWVGMLNLFQLPVHLSFLSVVNRWAFNFDEHPEMTTGGLLWFKDLSEPDPFCIIPMMSGTLMWLAMLVGRRDLLSQTQTLSPSSPKWFRTVRKYLMIMPLLTIPIWSSLPAAFNLYWVVTIMTNVAVNVITRSNSFRKFFRISDFLPGTKLARMNKITSSDVIKPKVVFAFNPTKPKLRPPPAPSPSPSPPSTL